MTHNTKEELERLFKQAVPLAKEFNKRTYSDLFQSKYEEFRSEEHTSELQSQR